MNKYNLDRALAFIKRTMDLDRSADPADSLVGNEAIDSASGADVIPPSPSQNVATASMPPNDSNEEENKEENKEEEEEEPEEPEEPKQPNDNVEQMLGPDDATIVEGDNDNPLIDLRSYFYPPYNSTKADELFMDEEADDQMLDYWYPPEREKYPLRTEFDCRGLTIWYQSKANLNRAMFMLVHFLLNITDSVVEQLYNFDRTSVYIEIESFEGKREAVKHMSKRKFKNEVVRFHQEWSRVLRYILSSIGFDWFQGLNPSITAPKEDTYYRALVHEHNSRLKFQQRYIVDYFGLDEAKMRANRDDLIANNYGQCLINEDLLHALGTLLMMRKNVLVDNYALDGSYTVDGFKTDQVFWQLVHSKGFLSAGYDILANKKPDFTGWPVRIYKIDPNTSLLRILNAKAFTDLQDKKIWTYDFANPFPHTPDLLFPNNICADSKRFYKSVPTNVRIEQNILCKQLQYGATCGEKYKGPTDVWGKNKHPQKVTPKVLYHKMFFPILADLDTCIKVSDRLMAKTKGMKCTKIYEAADLLNITDRKWYMKPKYHMPKWYRCHLCNFTIMIDREVKVYRPPDVKNPKWKPEKEGAEVVNELDWGAHGKRDRNYPGFQFLGERKGAKNEGMMQHRVAVFFPFVDVKNTETSPYQSRFSICNTVADKGLREMRNHYNNNHSVGDLGSSANRYFFGKSDKFEKQEDTKRKSSRATQYTDLWEAVADGVDLETHDWLDWDYWQKKESNADKKKKVTSRTNVPFFLILFSRS